MCIESAYNLFLRTRKDVRTYAHKQLADPIFDSYDSIHWKMTILFTNCKVNYSLNSRIMKE